MTSHERLTLHIRDIEQLCDAKNVPQLRDKVDIPGRTSRGQPSHTTKLRCSGHQRKSLARMDDSSLDEVESLVTIRDRILSRLPRIPGQGTEEAALSLLALRKRGGDPNALIRMQHPSGGWPGFPGIGPPNAFHTGLALVALRPFQTSSVQPVVERAFGWLSVFTDWNPTGCGAGNFASSTSRFNLIR